jgi:hypothetical protein
MVLLWIANLLVLLVVVPLVLLLAGRVLRLLHEAQRYAADIRTHTTGLTGALEPVPELADTRDRVAVVKEHAAGYVAALERTLPNA